MELADASDGEADAPLALNLALPAGYEPSPDVEVLVEAWPNEDTELALEAGDTVSLHEVAANAEVRDGLASIRIDGAAIPPQYVGESGAVDFRVQVIDLDAAYTGMTHVTVRYVDSGIGPAWIDANFEENDFVSLGAEAVHAHGGPGGLDVRCHGRLLGSGCS